jgi:hypothetical protein
MAVVRALTAIGLFCLTMPSAAASVKAACDDVLPDRRVDGVGGRPVTTDDLVRLRDYGMVGDTLVDKSPVSLSPDGKQAALLLRRANPVTNDYCQGLVIVGVDGASTARLVDTGGDFIRYRIPNLRGAIVPSGTADIVTPSWSPDGKWIAYRKAVDGRVAGWIVRADGRDAHAAIVADIDVDAIAWSADGRTLLYSAWPALRDAERAIDEEGRGGWLYDRRTLPVAGARPFPQQPSPHSYFAFDLATARTRPATAEERYRLDPSADPSWPSGAAVVATASDGSRAWAASDDPARYLAPTRLWVQRPGGPPVRCAFATCGEQVQQAWWSADGHRLRFLRREGWANSRLAFYDWDLDGHPPRRTFVTDDVFANCQSRGDLLLCSREASREPRRLVLLDPVTGGWRTVFDLNPAFAWLRLGTVKRLYWRNAYGTPCFGDLVLPPNHRDGERHPLIVVQYRTKGFLRGAVGDQYPIQAFATRGYAVLSVERTPSWAESRAPAGNARGFEDIQKADQAGWIDRRNVLSSLLTGIDLVTRLGVADPDRVGITGVSDAAVSAWFALIATGRFKAAAVGSCCFDPKTTLLAGGEAWAEQMEQYGYPAYTAKRTAYWTPISLAENVDHVTVPILMQLSDDEYSLGLEAYESLREHGRAVEMRVFPGEHHYEWQPAHRRAIYERNLDWFDFWMRGIEDPDPSKRDQYARWHGLRATARCSPATATSASVCGTNGR